MGKTVPEMFIDFLPLRSPLAHVALVEIVEVEGILVAWVADSQGLNDPSPDDFCVHEETKGGEEVRLAADGGSNVMNDSAIWPFQVRWPYGKFQWTSRQGVTVLLSADEHLRDVGQKGARQHERELGVAMIHREQAFLRSGLADVPPRVEEALGCFQ